MTETIIINESTPENSVILNNRISKAITKKLIKGVVILTAAVVVGEVLRKIADANAEAE